MLETQVQLLAEFDAELGRTLSISASPDFAVRVARQARDAGEARGQRWIPAPMFAGLGVAAAIVLAVWVRQAPVSDTEVFHPKAEATRPRAEDVVLKPEPTEVPEATPSDVPLSAVRHTPTYSPDRKRIASVEPPVIVEPSRALAIQRLRELMTDGRLDQKMLPPPATPETVLAELSIAPLEIADIRVRDVEIVGRPADVEIVGRRAASPEKEPRP
jgi:hypothetical protein